MTIAGRNRLRLLSICISFFIFLFALMSCITIFLMGKLNFLPEYLKKEISSGFGFTGFNPAAVCFAVLLFSFLSFIFLCYIYFMFKKIHAAEICFFEIFVLSFSFESIRLLFPFYSFSGLILAELSGISRAVYFFRFAGLLSLFVSTLFSVKNVTRQISYIVFLIGFLSFSISISMPMSNTAVSTAFISHPLFISSYITVAAAIYIFSFLSIAMEYIFNGIKDFAVTGAGFLLMIAGYNMLLFCSGWFSVIAGLIFFAYGVFSFIRKIHNYYLWQ